MSDLIDRQAAIDAVERNSCNTQRAIDAVNALPSVQPEPSDAVYRLYKRAYEAGQRNAQPEKAQLSGEDATSDCISRQAAIDAVDKLSDKPIGYFESAIDVLVDLPSVQLEPCEDVVSREAVSKWLKQYGQDVLHGKYKFSLMYIWKNLMNLPSVHPTYTDAEVQKMQDMHQAEIEKAFDLGREDARAEIIHCGECKHKGTKNCVANVWTNVWGAILGVTVKDDFYCGLAERRTDEQTM